MRITLTIGNKEKTRLAKFIAQELGQQVKSRLDNANSQISIKIKDYLHNAFWQSEAVISMTTKGGKLKEDLGLDSNINNKLEIVISKVLEKIELVPKNIVYGNGVRISYILKALPFGYGDMLSLPGSSYISSPSGIEIPWMHWLLVRGPGILGRFVGRVTNAGQASRSRSGTALMFHRMGSTWFLEPGKAGVGDITPDDNFLTKVFEVLRPINNIITQEVTAVLS